jgi:Ca2+-binding RTX toxin-like protein
MPFVNSETGADNFVLTPTQFQQVNLQNGIVLSQPTSVGVFSSAEFAGVHLWAVDATNGQALAAGGGFQGVSLSDIGFGFSTVTLPAGTWYLAASASAGSTAPSLPAFVAVSSTMLPGVPFIANLPMGVYGNPGAWRAEGFTVAGNPQAFLETEAVGGKFALMTEGQFQAFKAAYPTGYVGGSFDFLKDLGAGTDGTPATHLQGEVALAPGGYEVVWINDTNGWAGGAANFSFFGDASVSSGKVNGAGGLVQTSLPSADADYLVANPQYAEIHAQAGDDTILGTTVQDYLRGDDGNDSISGGPAFDDANGNQGNDTIHGNGGDDYSVGGKGDDLLFGDAGDDIVWGNLGNDTCNGGDGNDQVRGGQGDDSLTGGNGNDFISGDRGNDTESGGAGADVFHTSQDAGIDKVLDFNLAEGDRVMVDPGTTYTVSQVGADTVIDMGSGNQMILVGVSMTSLTGAWIFGA